MSLHSKHYKFKGVTLVSENKRQESESEYILAKLYRLTYFHKQDGFTFSRVERLSLDTELGKRFSKTLPELLPHFDLKEFPPILAVSLTPSARFMYMGIYVR